MSLYDIILLIGLVQGVLLSIGLALRNAGKKNVNYYFVALIFGITVAILCKLIYTNELFEKYTMFWFWLDTVAYAIGPLWYYTIKKSTSNGPIFTKSELLWLSPTLYHIGTLIYLYTFPKEELVALMNGAAFYELFLGFVITIMAINIIYYARARYVLSKVDKNNFPKLLINGQNVLLGLIILWLGSFLFSMIINDSLLGLQVYNLSFASLSVLTFSIAMLVIVKPNSFYFLTQTFDSSESFILQKVAEEVQRYLTDEEAYLEVGFNLQKLSEQVGANPALTSKAINKILKSSFSDLVNQYRVKHFIKMVRSGEYSNFTYWGIAEQAGFGNKVTFYNSFKKFMGTTPKEYLKAQ